jgi:molybdopterin-guanine dinucleotide biosynthesis protein A
LAKNRQQYFSKIKPTLQKPILIIENITNELLFLKSFDDKKGMIFNLVVINKYDMNIAISSHPIRENNIVNKLINKANIIWTFVDNIFKAGINFSRQTTTAGHDKSLIPYSLSKSPTDDDIIAQNILKLQELIKIDIPCVILAGGKSSRMGEDKCFLPFKDTTLIKYQYKRLKKIFSQVYISSKTNKFDFDCDIIYDKTDDISSPMVALKSILEFIQSKQVFIIPVDTPFIQKNTIVTLYSYADKFDITIPATNNKIHNLTGIFSKDILNLVEDFLQNDNHKIFSLAKQTNLKIISIDDEQQFINLNTPSDYLQIKGEI